MLASMLCDVVALAADAYLAYLRTLAQTSANLSTISTKAAKHDTIQG